MRWLSSYKSLIYSSLLWIPSHPIFSRTWLPIYCLTKHCKSLSLPTESSPQLINMLYYLPPKKKKKRKENQESNFNYSLGPPDLFYSFAQLKLSFLCTYFLIPHRLLWSGCCWKMLLRSPPTAMFCQLQWTLFGLSAALAWFRVCLSPTAHSGPVHLCSPISCPSPWTHKTPSMHPWCGGLVPSPCFLLSRLFPSSWLFSDWGLPPIFVIAPASFPFFITLNWKLASDFHLSFSPTGL